MAPVTRSVPIRAPKNKAFEAQYTALLRFLKKEMVQKDGVYTNYRNDQQTGTKASGHAYLSESSGTMAAASSVNPAKCGVFGFLSSYEASFLAGTPV